MVPFFTVGQQYETCFPKLTDIKWAVAEKHCRQAPATKTDVQNNTANPKDR